ncbi:MAG: sigma-54-dependent Fis family transcriptional regulator [Acidobacteria bacterium]|nr:MAG: sigma-54-dependent Fis family transcriptional regulator [Acidobacteriota bacterium]
MDISLLVASHDKHIRDLCSSAAKLMGFEGRSAESISNALDTIRSGGVDIILADAQMPAFNMIELIKTARGASPEPDVIVIATATNAGLAYHAINQGAHDYLIDPFERKDLERLLNRLIQKKQMSTENRLLREQLEARQGLGALIGASARMQKVYETVLKVGTKRHPVLVLGESGTGKELVARAIHAYGPWHDLPFVPVDCGALSSTLIESELFGHVRGAFTGASQNRVGLLVAGGKGTVFLDEIAELPVELQAKLLRAIQEREVRPLGGNQRMPLEARIIAGTNQHLESAITRGTFRKDLFFRLNVVSIKLPPLRDRKNDIPLLAHHFIDRYAGHSGSTRGISYDAMSRLMGYDWPGNVRELENCIQRALALGSTSEIQVKDLPSSLLYATEAESGKQRFSTLREMERDAIRRALEMTGGDRLRAAKLLGIGKTTVYRKIKEYGLEDAVGAQQA